MRILISTTSFAKNSCLPINIIQNDIFKEFRTKKKNFPKKIYYALLKAPVKGTKLYKYTSEQVSINVLKIKHWGPWDLKPPR